MSVFGPISCRLFWTFLSSESFGIWCSVRSDGGHVLTTHRTLERKPDAHRILQSVISSRSSRAR